MSEPYARSPFGYLTSDVATLDRDCPAAAVTDTQRIASLAARGDIWIELGVAHTNGYGYLRREEGGRFTVGIYNWKLRRNVENSFCEFKPALDHLAMSLVP